LENRNFIRRRVSPTSRNVALIAEKQEKETNETVPENFIMLFALIADVKLRFPLSPEPVSQFIAVNALKPGVI